MREDRKEEVLEWTERRGVHTRMEKKMICSELMPAQGNARRPGLGLVTREACSIEQQKQGRV